MYTQKIINVVYIVDNMVFIKYCSTTEGTKAEAKLRLIAVGERSVTLGLLCRLTSKHLKDAKALGNQPISLPPEAFFHDASIPVGYANAHPRLKALDFQPSALLPSEAAAVPQAIMCKSVPKNNLANTHIRKILWKSVLKPHQHSLGEADLWLAPHKGSEATGVVSPCPPANQLRRC